MSGVPISVTGVPETVKTCRWDESWGAQRGGYLIEGARGGVLVKKPSETFTT